MTIVGKHAMILAQNNTKSAIAHELNSVLVFALRKELGTCERLRMNAREFVRLFQSLYERKYTDILPISRATASTYMRRAFVWCGEDKAKLEGIIRWVVEDWETIRSALSLSGRPSIGLFGSAELFHRIRDLRETPVTVSTKNRVTADASPAEGWGT